MYYLLCYSIDIQCWSLWVCKVYVLDYGDLCVWTIRGSSEHLRFSVHYADLTQLFLSVTHTHTPRQQGRCVVTTAMLYRLWVCIHVSSTCDCHWGSTSSDLSKTFTLSQNQDRKNHSKVWLTATRLFLWMRLESPGPEKVSLVLWFFNDGTR